MKSILDEMEEHIAEIRNLQRNFDYHSRRLEKLMKVLSQHHFDNDKESRDLDAEAVDESSIASAIQGQNDLLRNS